MICTSIIIWKRKTLLNIFKKRKKQQSIITPPKTKWNIYQDFVNRLDTTHQKFYENNDNVKTFFINIEEIFKSYLTEYYKFDAHNYTLSDLMKQIVKYDSSITQPIQEDFKELFQDWLLFKYAKKAPERQHIQQHYHRLSALVKAIYQHNEGKSL